MQTTIRFCPVCGVDGFEPYQIKAFQCNDCGFLYYHNVAVTSSAIISIDRDILLVRRAREPQQGMLDLPGGFVEADETAEQGLLRELAEELGCAFSDPGRYLCNYTNRYEYAGVVYNTLDIFFHMPLTNRPSINVNDDVSGFEWRRLTEVDTNEIAFDSIKQAIQHFRNAD